MHWVKTTALAAGAAAAAGGAIAQTKQQVTGPVATYWMSAATQSGLGAGGGANAMAAMMGGGSNVSKTLTLQLGSSRKAAAGPSAEHLPPVGLRAGQSLPLVTPAVQRTKEWNPDEFPKDYKPKGKILIYWGCGERVKQGQPIVIDFATIAGGKVPPGLAALNRSLAITPMNPPSSTRNATYGEWPNEKTRTSVPAQGSLIGDHLIRGNYSPEIKFALAQDQDFLGGLNLTTNRMNPTGSAQIGWNTVPYAKAYLATTMGMGENDTMVMWSSSEIQTSTFATPDYISGPDITRLVGNKALMGPAATTCTVPQEVLKAAPHTMVQLAAYGGETNISYPPRPADPKTPWNIDWTLKVRYKSQTSGMLGMNMAEMMGGGQPGGASGMGGPMGGMGAQPQQQQQPALPGGALGGAILRGLGGRLPGL